MDQHADPFASPQHRQASNLAQCLSRCLVTLDTLDEGVAAAHLSMALDLLKRNRGV